MERGGDRGNNIFLKGLCAILIMLHHAVSIFGTTQMRGSKYVQSDTSKIYKKVKADLSI